MLSLEGVAAALDAALSAATSCDCKVAAEIMDGEVSLFVSENCCSDVYGLHGYCGLIAVRAISEL